MSCLAASKFLLKVTTILVTLMMSLFFPWYDWQLKFLVFRWDQGPQRSQEDASNPRAKLSFHNIIKV